MREMRVSNSVSIYSLRNILYTLARLQDNLRANQVTLRSSAFSRSRISSPIGFMAFKNPPYRPYKRPIYNRQSVEPGLENSPYRTGKPAVEGLVGGDWCNSRIYSRRNR